MQELASQSLELVSRELANTLDTARGEIEDFVDGQSNSEALVRAASMLHLAAGALKIVEIHGAALLAEEMEQTCRAIHEARGKDSDQAIEALTRAMVQLPAYLERLMSGGSDVALVLLPLLNDLRTARQQPMLSEGTLVLLNTGPFERLRSKKPASSVGQSFGKEVPKLAQKLRPKFQSALLGWIRGQGGNQHLAELVDACDRLESQAESEPVRQLWAVTAGVLVALRNGSVEPTVQIKRLLGQVDRQLKRLIDSGEQSFVTSPPVELLNSLLYYVARAADDDPRIADLKRAFGVEAAIPDAEAIEQAREDLAGPSVRLMRTVADAIKEDLGEVKDVLDIFVRTGMVNMTELQPQLDMLKKIGDTLGVLGLETARDRIQADAAKLGDIVERDAVDDISVLENIAASLLDVEDMLERELVSAGARESLERTDLGDALESNQFRHVTQAVMRECIVNLAKIKEAVVKVLDEPGAVRALDQVQPQLRGIVAGLLMLNKNKAVNVIERIGRNITTRLAPGAKPLKASLIERLADAIVSIEYFMETVALGRADPDYMLDNANRCLDVLEDAARGKPSAPADQNEPAPEPEPELEPDETAAEEEPSKLSVMEVQEDHSEPELVEIFIEEAKEELDRIREYLPRWMDQPQDNEALIAVRRSFHTLKGSGRVVGAQLLGEFAWSVENLLNRIINKTLAPSREMIEFVGEAAATLPALIDQLEIGIRPAEDINALMARAETYAEGRSESETAIHRGIDADALARAAAGSEMDPVLRQIFIKELREHLKTIRQFVGLGAAGRGPSAITEPLYRACHTLFGSARMAGCEPAIELAAPLERRIRAGYESRIGLSVAALDTLGRFVEAMDALSRTLESDEAPVADSALVAEIESIELAGVEDAGAADETEGDDTDRFGQTGYMAAPEFDVGEIDEALEASTAESEPESAAEFGALTEAESASEPAAESESGYADEAGSQSELEADAVAEVASEAEAEAEAEAGETADYDPEIAAIFCEEAAELLDQGETQLQALRHGASPDPAVAELKRLLHTLKGGARLAGIAAMGDLSHALETMLPKMASPPAGADGEGLRLVQQALDRLQQMRDAVDSGQRAVPARDLIEAFDRFGTAASASAAPAEPSAPAEALAPPAADDAQAEPATTPDTASEPPVEWFGDETRIEPIGEIDLRAEPERHAEPPEKQEPLEKQEPPEELVPAAESDDDTRLQPAVPLSAAEPASETLPVAPAATPPAPEPPRVPVMEQGQAARVERAEVARVDAALLDELLNGAGEISIFQSRLNQQIHSIEFHLGELGQTVTRLREQLRSLEAETEAQILHKHQGDRGADEHFDPLELDRYSTIQQLSRALAETSNDVASINELLHGLASEADTLLTQQTRVTTEMQDGLMQTRMVTFDRQATRLARIVRQAAQDTNKLAELTINGAQSQLDRQILEAVVPALEHLLRNAVVHGIEPAATRAVAGKPEAGSVTLTVRRDGAEVLIEVSDDGAGLDLHAIRRKASEKGLIRDGETMADEDMVEMILLPGFSTADELTQAAGRGVGMDVVDNEIKRLGGSLRIETERGKGTRFVIRLPYTLAITHALIVDVGDETFALPLPTVEGIARVRREQLLDLLTDDDPRLAHGDGSYRIQHLGSLVGSSPSALPEDEGSVSLVLVRAGDNSTALLTDSLEGSREIIVKTLGPHVTSVPGVSGATILGDGRVVVILDAGTLVRAQPGAAKPPPQAPALEPDVLTALVVDDSITMRRVTQRLLERRGVRVHTARDGLDAIEVLREHDADFILLDIEMPRMDGYQFATHVRNDPKFKDLPIIMVTSRSGEKHRARAIEIGVNDYLSKPYQEAQLIAAIESLLGRSM